MGRGGVVEQMILDILGEAIVENARMAGEAESRAMGPASWLMRGNPITPVQVGWKLRRVGDIQQDVPVDGGRGASLGRRHTSHQVQHAIFGLQ
jgi:hypothetical protein